MGNVLVLKAAIDYQITMSLGQIAGFTSSTPMLAKARTVYLALLSELSSMAEMDDPATHLQGMIRRTRDDLEGVDIPSEAEIVSRGTAADWNDLPRFIAAIKDTYVKSMGAMLVYAGYEVETE